MMRRRSALVSCDQAAISLRVRLQPWQRPVAASITQICTQGVSIAGFSMSCVCFVVMRALLAGTCGQRNGAISAHGWLSDRACRSHKETWP